MPSFRPPKKYEFVSIVIFPGIFCLPSVLHETDINLQRVLKLFGEGENFHTHGRNGSGFGGISEDSIPHNIYCNCKTYSKILLNYKNYNSLKTWTD